MKDSVHGGDDHDQHNRVEQPLANRVDTAIFGLSFGFKLFAHWLTLEIVTLSLPLTS